MSAIIWASCFLAPPDPIYAAFSQLGEFLREQEVELVLFGSEGDYSAYRGFHHYACPIVVGEQGRSGAFWAGSAKLPIGAGALDELIALDRAWGVPYSALEAELYALKGVAFWERAFELMQPSAILCWGTTLPISRLLLRLAQQRQRAAYVIERGPLEGTLMLSLSGQTALTSANTLPSLIAPSLDEPRLSDRWDAVASFYHSSQDRHYSSFNRIPDSDLSLDVEPAQGVKVLFLGTFDIGSGCSFADPALGDVYATWVNSSSEGARLVCEALARIAPGATLWIKPHPACPFTVNEPSDGSVVVRDMSNIDVRYLMRSSDICVTLASTTQMLALLEDRPVVTLGNGFLMGRDIAYDVREPEELPELLQQALEGRDWLRRLREGRALLAAMFESDLIGLAPDVPTRLKIEDVATLLGRFAGYRPHQTRPAKSRIRDFQTFRSLARLDVKEAVDRREQERLALVSERDRALLEAAAWADRCAQADKDLAEALSALSAAKEEAVDCRIAQENAEAALVHAHDDYSATADCLMAEKSQYFAFRRGYDELVVEKIKFVQENESMREMNAILEARLLAFEKNRIFRIFKRFMKFPEMPYR